MKIILSVFISFFLSLVAVSQLPSLPLDFESTTINYSFTDFDGGATTKISNPQVSGINTSANVAKMIKSIGQPWGGSWIKLAAPIDFSVNKTFKVKVFSPRIGAKLLLKVENETNAALSFEKEATSTLANAWEELTFDYTAINTANLYHKLVFIFDNGTIGNGTANFTWLFDDVKLTTAGGGGGTLAQMNVPVTFDDATINYGLVGFGGAEQSSIVTDPTLATNKVAKVIKINTAELWAGTTVSALNGTVQTGFATNLPFAAGATKMNVRVWSSHANIPVRLKVEDKNDPTKSCETEATTTTANGWQTLEFNFANQSAGTAALNFATAYNKLSIFFNFGVTGAVAGERIYYFDDVKFGGITPTGSTLPVLPLDFESTTINYSFTDFDGGATTKISNPQVSGINTSANVAKMIKSIGQPWGGSWIKLAAPIDFSVNKTFKVKVFSPRIGAKLLLKVENETNAALSFEKEATSTLANAWEELTFDYTAINTANLYHKLVFIFDNGTIGNGTANFTWLFDDVKLTTAGGGGGTLAQMNVPVTFDDATINYGLVGFGGAEQSSIVTDPTLATNKVAKVIKINTAELWAGTTVSALNGTVQTGFATNLPFAAGATKMNVRVWSPHANIPVRLKVEDKNDPTKSCETEATTTTANGWQTLEFNFANQSAGTAALNFATAYNKLSIFFNFGVTGAVAGERIYYFDDVKFGGITPTGSTLPVLPLDFESTTINYSFTDFDGGATTKISNPQVSGINTSANVAKMIKSTGQPWGGSWIKLAAPIDFSVNKTFKVKVFSPRIGAKLLLKVENELNGAQFYELEAESTVANAWEELTFNFSAINTANQYNKLIFIFDLGTMGNGSANYTWLFDDIRLTTAIGPVLTQMNVPVTFDDATINYGLVGFGGAEQSTIVTDPTLATNKVAKVIKSNAAELWAGTTITALLGTTQTSFQNNIPFTSIATKMNVRVWSSHNNIKVRLKVEDKTDPTKSCETEATFTGASNTWQTLEFNFANQAQGTAALNTSYNLNKASIFFNFGITGQTAGERIYYFDDLKFGAIPSLTTPTVNSPVNICQNTATTPLTATPTAGSTLIWYLVPTGGIGSTNSPTPNSTNSGQTIYYVSQISNTGIESGRSQIEVNINPIPTAPTAISPSPNCQNAVATALSANILSSHTPRWYSVLSGIGSTTAIVPNTLVVGSTNYFVSQVNNSGCESPKTTISVITNPTPLAPIVNSPISFCLNSTPTVLSASIVTGNTAKWYNTATGGTALGAAPTPNTTTVGNVNYYVSQTNSFSCESPRANLVVNVLTTPNAPTVISPISYCQNNSVLPLTANADQGNALNWYTTATGGPASITPPTPAANVSGIFNFYVSQKSGNNCESSRSLISVNINALPPLSSLSVSPNTSILPNQTTTINATNFGTGNNLEWYRNDILVQSSNVNSLEVNINKLGSYYMKVTNANGCSTSSNSIKVDAAVSANLFVYPIPSNGIFDVRYFSEINNLKPRRITILSSDGKMVYSAKYAMFSEYTPMRVDLRTMSNGIYHITLLDETNKIIANQKILINK